MMKKLLAVVWETRDELIYVIIGALIAGLVPWVVIRGGYQLGLSTIWISAFCFYQAGKLRGRKEIEPAVFDRASQWTEEELKWAGKDTPDD